MQTALSLSCENNLIPVKNLFLKAIFVHLEGVSEEKDFKGKEKDGKDQKQVASDLGPDQPGVVFGLCPE